MEHPMNTTFTITSRMRSTHRVAAALAYAKQGLPVLALWGIHDGRCACGSQNCPSAGKHPISSAFPNGHKSATIDANKIKQVWNEHPDANIGVVPGEGLIVLDVDGDEGEASIAPLDLPATATVVTGRGRHRYFLRENSTTFAKLKNVDVRTAGNGYVVAPPSIHVSGRRYRWRRTPENAVALPSSKRRSVAINFAPKALKVRQGERNNFLTSVGGFLRRKFLAPQQIEAVLNAINEEVVKPALPDDEVRRISRSVGQYDAPHENAFGEMADVVAQEPTWLCKPYIPRHTLTMLEGNPGEGKSNFTLAVAAAISRGEALPWSDTSAAGTVLLMSAEDDPARVLKRRLEENGAEDSRIRYQRELFSLDDTGLDALRAELQEHRADLVIIDPIVAFMSATDDMNKATDMTRFLNGLDELANEFDCAIMLVRHLRKVSDGTAINKGLGSIALAGRVRSMLLLGRHPTEKDQRAIVHIKSNYAKEGDAIVFALEDSPAGVPRVRWLGTDGSITAADLSPAERSVGRPDTELQQAKDFLLGLLKDGSKRGGAVTTASEAHGISKPTLRRAATSLGVVITKGRNSSWSLPDRDNEEAEE